MFGPTGCHLKDLANLPEEEEKKQALSVDGVTVGAERCLGGYVITRVYLTRKITYTYSNGRIAALALRLAEEGSTLSSIPNPPNLNIEITNTGGELTLPDNSAALTTIAEQLSNVGTTDEQGRGLNFESFSLRGVTFSQIFPRPVAVGYDGTTFSFLASRPKPGARPSVLNGNTKFLPTDLESVPLCRQFQD